MTARLCLNWLLLGLATLCLIKNVQSSVSDDSKKYGSDDAIKYGEIHDSNNSEDGETQTTENMDYNAYSHSDNDEKKSLVMSNEQSELTNNVNKVPVHSDEEQDIILNENEENVGIENDYFPSLSEGYTEKRTHRLGEANEYQDREQLQITEITVPENSEDGEESQIYDNFQTNFNSETDGYSKSEHELNNDDQDLYLIRDYKSDSLEDRDAFGNKDGDAFRNKNAAVEVANVSEDSDALEDKDSGLLLNKDGGAFGDEDDYVLGDEYSNSDFDENGNFNYDSVMNKKESKADAEENYADSDIHSSHFRDFYSDSNISKLYPENIESTYMTRNKDIKNASTDDENNNSGLQEKENKASNTDVITEESNAKLKPTSDIANDQNYKIRTSKKFDRKCDSCSLKTSNSNHETQITDKKEEEIHISHTTDDKGKPYSSSDVEETHLANDNEENHRLSSNPENDDSNDNEKENEKEEKKSYSSNDDNDDEDDEEESYTSDEDERGSYSSNEEEEEEESNSSNEEEDEPYFSNDIYNLSNKRTKSSVDENHTSDHETRVATTQDNNEYNSLPDKTRIADHETRTTSTNEKESHMSHNEHKTLSLTKVTCLPDDKANLTADDETQNNNEETDMTNDETEMTNDETETTNDETEMTNDETETTNDETETTNDETEMTNDETETTNDETETTNDETQNENDKTEIVDDETEIVDDETEAVDDETEEVDDETEAVDDETEAVDDETDTVDDETHTVDDETDAVDDETDAVDDKTDAVDIDDKTDAVDDETDSSDDETDTVDDETGIDDESLTVDGETETVDDETVTIDDETQNKNEETETDDETQIENEKTETTGGETQNKKEKTETADDKTRNENKKTETTNNETQNENEETETVKEDETRETTDDEIQNENERTETGDETQTEDEEVRTADKEAPGGKTTKRTGEADDTSEISTEIIEEYHTIKEDIDEEQNTKPAISESHKVIETSETRLQVDSKDYESPNEISGKFHGTDAETDGTRVTDETKEADGTRVTDETKEADGTRVTDETDGTRVTDGTNLEKEESSVSRGTAKYTSPIEKEKKHNTDSPVLETNGTRHRDNDIKDKASETEKSRILCTKEGILNYKDSTGKSEEIYNHVYKTKENSKLIESQNHKAPAKINDKSPKVDHSDDLNIVTVTKTFFEQKHHPTPCEPCTNSQPKIKIQEAAETTDPIVQSHVSDKIQNTHIESKSPTKRNEPFERKQHEIGIYESIKNSEAIANRAEDLNTDYNTKQTKAVYTNSKHESKEKDEQDIVKVLDERNAIISNNNEFGRENNQLPTECLDETTNRMKEEKKMETKDIGFNTMIELIYKYPGNKFGEIHKDECKNCKT